MIEVVERVTDVGRRVYEVWNGPVFLGRFMYFEDADRRARALAARLAPIEPGPRRGPSDQCFSCH